MRRFYNRFLYAAVMAVMGFCGCKDNDSSMEEKFSVTKDLFYTGLERPQMKM
ncbi:MAG: hypothetical protein J6O39_05985 [Treponema sp.]|nr:hypothetical protein [Treponema sp.]